jgi:hypothetical protein
VEGLGVGKLVVGANVEPAGVGTPVGVTVGGTFLPARHSVAV